jgi:hypothetical protein
MQGPQRERHAKQAAKSTKQETKQNSKQNTKCINVIWVWMEDTETTRKCKAHETSESDRPERLNYQMVQQMRGPAGGGSNGTHMRLRHETNIDYILVVGHSGLVTGCGGESKSTCTPSRVQRWSVPDDKQWSTQSRHKPPILQNDHDQPAKRLPVARHPDA